MTMTRAVVPSLFTVLNMFCGFMSIIYSTTNSLHTAAWLIVLGAVFDSLDGLMARLTKSSSAFGVEFDSLSDVVTFGAAPSVLLYQLHFSTLGGPGILLSSLPLILGGIRLARFNVQLVGFSKDYFRGLPIPSQAIAICAFVLTYASASGAMDRLAATLLIPLVIILSVLMVTTVRYDTLPSFSRRGLQQHPIRLSLFVVGSVLVIATQGAAFFPVMVAFAVSGPFRWAVKSIRNLRHLSPKEEQEEDPEISRLDV